MDKNKAFFLECIGDFLNERETMPQEGINWEIIYDFALKHQMINIICHQCGGFMSEPAAAKFKKSGKYSLFYRVKIESLIGVLENVCKNIKIDYAFVKGPVVAQYYAVPEYRSMGDLDLMVHTPDRRKVCDELLKIGFKNQSQNEEHEWVFWYDNMELELHDKLIYKGAPGSAAQIDFFDGMWAYVHDGKMDESFHFIYLMHHLKKHLTGIGAGFRQFLDIACVVKNCHTLDKDWILEKLRDLDMLDFSKLCFALCKRWFDADMNGFDSDMDEAFYEEATETIFANGVFGFCSDENKANIAINDVGSGKNRYYTYFRSVWQNLFPSYKNMSAMQQYRFLRNRPFLLPFAWVYRIFLGIKMGRVKSFGKKIDTILVPKEKIDKRVEEMKKWKLDK